MKGLLHKGIHIDGREEKDGIDEYEDEVELYRGESAVFDVVREEAEYNERNGLC